MGWFGHRPLELFHVDTENVASTPIAGLVRSFLALGVSVSADEIVFGVPAGVALDEDAERQETQKERLRLRELLPRQESQDPAPPLVMESGADTVPVYLRLKGTYERYMGVPAAVWPFLPLYITYLRVSVGGTPGRPGPQRYIELPRKRGAPRRFVEVELVMGRDNALRIRLLGVREEQQTVEVHPPIQAPLELDPQEVERVLKRTANAPLTS